MIVDIIQQKTNFDMSWIAEVDGKSVSKAEAPFVKGRFQTEIVLDNGENLTLYFNPSDTRFGTKLADRLSFKLFQNGELVGSIVGRTKKTGFLKAYPYYEYHFFEKELFGYEVGFGKDGLYLCIYEGEELKAIVEKELKVVDYRDRYRAYLPDSSFWRAVFPFILYYDATAYGDVMDVAVRKVTVKYVYTPQKELKAKYDPGFIPRVVEADGQRAVLRQSRENQD